MLLSLWTELCFPQFSDPTLNLSSSRITDMLSLQHSLPFQSLCQLTPLSPHAVTASDSTVSKQDVAGVWPPTHDIFLFQLCPSSQFLSSASFLTKPDMLLSSSIRSLQCKCWSRRIKVTSVHCAPHLIAVQFLPEWSPNMQVLQENARKFFFSQLAKIWRPALHFHPSDLSEPRLVCGLGSRLWPLSTKQHPSDQLLWGLVLSSLLGQILSSNFLLCSSGGWVAF